MKTPRYFVLAFATVLLAAQFAYVSPANAQTSEQTEQDRLSRVMDPSTSVDEFRKEYDNYLTDLESDMRLLSSARILPYKNRQAVSDSLQQIEAARRGMASMSSDDWVKAREIYAEFPGWRNSLLSPALRSRIESAQALKGGEGPNPNEITPDTCPNEADVASNSDILFQKQALIVLEGVEKAIPEELIIPKVAAIGLSAISENILIGYETGRTIHLECISATKADIEQIVDFSRSKLEFDLGSDFAHIASTMDQKTTLIVNNDNTNRDTILDSLTTNGTNITAAVTSAKTEIVNNSNSNTTTLNTAISNATTSIVNNSNSNTSTLNTNINSTRTAIIDNSNTNTTNIVNNDNTNRSLIIDNNNANAAALSDMILRTQIEADLAEADNATYVAWYVMPTAMGGHFDFARAIVVDTIAKLAGANAAKANAFLATSDELKNAGDYKGAYQNLRKAYKAALN